MHKKFIFILTMFSLSGLASVVFAQTATVSPKNAVITGDVISVDAGKIMLQTKDGELSVSLSEKTEYKRVPADNPSVKAAVAATFAEIGTGDKLMVLGMISEDRKTLPAKSVYLMTKSDIAGRQAKEKEKWSTRGMSGKVMTVNPDTKQITVEVRGLMGSTSVVLTPKTEAKYRRYAPNSVKYSEAVTSSFADLKAGDMLRAVGDKSADGVSFAAEEILTGAFQTVAGTVKSVDVAKNEVVITDLQSKKDVTVELGSASLLKKFPEQMAQMMAARQSGMGGAAGPGGQQQTRPANGAGGGQPGAGQGGGGFGGPRGGGGVDEMLDRFPNITAADLKVGDMIAVSSSKGTNLDRITAIKLLAGVEPFIRAAQMSSGGQRNQGSQSLSIPGLEGVDFQ